MSDVQSRRNFLGALSANIALATPLGAQDNALESKVRALLEKEDFDAAIKLAESEKGHEKLAAECHGTYANSIHKDLSKTDIPPELRLKFEALASKILFHYDKAIAHPDFSENVRFRTNRATLNEFVRSYDTALEDFKVVLRKEPRSVIGYSGIVDVLLRKGESDTIAETFENIKKKQELDAGALLNGSAQGVQRWMQYSRHYGGKIQSGSETCTFFNGIGELYMRAWMNQGKNGTVDERFSAEFRNEALFCTFISGAAAYAAQPYDTALEEYEKFVAPRHQKMKEHVEGNLRDAESLAPMYLIKIEFKNKEDLFRQLKNKAKK